MSHVILLCTDRPVPTREARTRRVRTVRDGGRTIRVEEDGFSVQPNEYYDQAVEELNFPMKPCRYELDLRPAREDARLLKEYLEQNLAEGETAQLWSVWVPRYPEDGVSWYRGRWDDLDEEALTLLESWNVCMTVER